jgi:hypothetical protein
MEVNGRMLKLIKFQIEFSHGALQTTLYILPFENREIFIDLTSKTEKRHT